MSHDVRPAAVAGSFYPAGSARLCAEVDEMLREAGAAPASTAGLKGLIVPHAGYVYSGPIAARAYRILRPRAQEIRRVVLVGPSHRAYFSGLALPDAVGFATPLGVVPVDTTASARLPGVAASASAHAREHALEVQLPFLQRVLGEGFELVPLLVGDASGEEVASALEALWGGPETLLVISSDLSHYLPYDDARRVDGETARRILDPASGPLAREEACGATPVNGLLLVAERRKMRVELLDLRNSGDTAGRREQVVGYGAFAFYEEAADVG